MKYWNKANLNVFNLSQDGTTAAEYAILSSLIAAVIVIIVTSVGGKTLANFSSVFF